ncbi:MAG: RNA-binding domain-containing protein, partial [Cystobacter sp.]
MTVDELEKRLKLGEDAVTEFKGTSRNKGQIDVRDIARAIAALANTKGGLLVLGVEDDGSVSGVGTQEQMDLLMRQVSQLCQDRLQPALFCTLRKFELQDQRLLVVEVPAFSITRPYHVDGKYYVRDANRSRDAKREELIRLLQSADYHFDEQPIEGSRLEDLDVGAARAFLANLYDESDLDSAWLRLLERLQCVDRGGTPTVTGMLLFGQEPQRWLGDARVSAVRYPGKEVTSEFTDRQELEGRLLDQIDATVA